MRMDQCTQAGDGGDRFAPPAGVTADGPPCGHLVPPWYHSPMPRGCFVATPLLGLRHGS